MLKWLVSFSMLPTHFHFFLTLNGEAHTQKLLPTGQKKNKKTPTYIWHLFLSEKGNNQHSFLRQFTLQSWVFIDSRSDRRWWNRPTGVDTLMFPAFQARPNLSSQSQNLHLRSASSLLQIWGGFGSGSRVGHPLIRRLIPGFSNPHVKGTRYWTPNCECVWMFNLATSKWLNVACRVLNHFEWSED